MDQNQNRRGFFKQAGVAAAIVLGVTPIASAGTLRSSERRFRSVLIKFPKIRPPKRRFRKVGIYAGKGRSFSQAEANAFVHDSLGGEEFTRGTLVSVEYAD